MKPEDFDRFVQQPIVGVLATLRQNGAPYTVPVWWLYRDDGIWVTGTYSRVWCRQLMRDGRTSLCIETTGELNGHVEFDGVATAYQRPEFEIWPISRQLAEKYVGRNDPANAERVDAFFANMQTEPRLLFRITPETTRAIDMRIYQGKRADREYQAGQRAAE